MNPQGNIRIFTLTICSVCSLGLLTVYYAQYGEKKALTLNEVFDSSEIPLKISAESSSEENYLISNACKMLDLNPWDKSVQKFLDKPKPLICSNLPLLTFIDNSENFTYTLKINKKYLKMYKVKPKDFIKCCFSLVTRINQNPENYTTYADKLNKWTECKDFTDKVLLPEHGEFVLVKCYKREKKKEKEFYRDMHPVVPVLPNAFLKMKAAEENVTSKLKTLNSEAKKLNVIILGIDSISKLNLRRVMPRTLNYLHEKNWIELKGYNKIGENTFPNLMAILNGKPTESVSLWWSNGSVKMDDCPAIWKDYNNAGYITLYAEDTPAISTFNYMKMGFVEKPTDYYMRPFMLAAHEKLYLKKLNGLPVCTGPVLALDHILNYAKRFYRTFKNFNHFSLLWSNSLSHNHLNAPKALDTSVVRFLNDLSDLGVYENSLVLLLSDHGMRFGEIRKTFIGYIEERSPFMFIWVPEWFQKKYPRKYYNMVINQNRLTSPFDIYVTLKTLLEMDDDKDFRRPNDTPFFENELIRTDPISEACPKCNGLFEVQPLNRTCSDASIDVNWCLCSEFREIDVQEKMALKVGLHIYNYIINKTNELIKREKIKKTLCSSWTFSKIYRGQEITVQNSRKKNFVYGYGEKRSNERIFVILIELNPGNTKFESSVKIYSDHNGENLKYEFLEYPKRLDSIYKTSECVKSSLLKHYCYCVRQ